MGIKQQDVQAEKVIIFKEDQQIIIENPSIQKVDMMGQKSYQISGDERVEEVAQEVNITDEDVQTVLEQAGVSKEQAKSALEKADGDIAQAIVDLQE